MTDPTNNAPGARQPHGPIDYPASQVPQGGQPEYATPGYPPAYAQPGYPPVSPKRPTPVIAAGAITIVVGVLVLLGSASAGVNSSGSVDPAETAGRVTAAVFFFVLAVAAIASGILLLTRRSPATRLTATIVAGLLALTCIGLIATIAVPILLWATESSKSWFVGSVQQSPGAYPAQYPPT